MDSGLKSELKRFALNLLKYCIAPSACCILLGFAVYWIEGWPMDYYEIFGTTFGVFIYMLLFTCLIQLKLISFNRRNKRSIEK